jgi:hypothetical protein
VKTRNFERPGAHPPSGGSLDARFPPHYFLRRARRRVGRDVCTHPKGWEFCDICYSRPRRVSASLRQALPIRGRPLPPPRCARCRARSQGSCNTFPPMPKSTSRVAAAAGATPPGAIFSDMSLPAPSFQGLSTAKRRRSPSRLLLSSWPLRPSLSPRHWAGADPMSVLVGVTAGAAGRSQAARPQRPRNAPINARRRPLYPGVIPFPSRRPSA